MYSMKSIMYISIITAQIRIVDKTFICMIGVIVSILSVNNIIYTHFLIAWLINYLLLIFLLYKTTIFTKVSQFSHGNRVHHGMCFIFSM